jgi:hypothetical protein
MTVGFIGLGVMGLIGGERKKIDPALKRSNMVDPTSNTVRGGR